MKISGQGKLLRIFIGDSDRYQGKPLYVALVERAREQGLAGATVLRGIMGFGAGSRIHTTSLLRLSQDLPLVVEIVDTEEKIDHYLHGLDEMLHNGLVTMEKADVRFYRSGRDHSESA
ncbi:MAG TPA: DUF190 domain-containing protein [Bacteroidetes bacterium]|nr:DUF190 domain-containing protein [Bacteroidota bacterium]